jgi:hypothetical protein
VISILVGAFALILWMHFVRRDIAELELRIELWRDYTDARLKALEKDEK